MLNRDILSCQNQEIPTDFQGSSQADIPTSKQELPSHGHFSDSEDLFRVLKLSRVQKKVLTMERNCSVKSFSSDIRLMVEAAANEMESVTLFQDPLPDPQYTNVILETVWRCNGMERYSTTM